MWYLWGSAAIIKEIVQPVWSSPTHTSTIPRPRSSLICFSFMKYFLLLEICNYEIRHYVAFLTGFSGVLQRFSSSVHVEACHSTFFLFTESFSFCLITAICENSLHVFTLSLLICSWTFSILGPMSMLLVECSSRIRRYMFSVLLTNKQRHS